MWIYRERLNAEKNRKGIREASTDRDRGEERETLTEIQERKGKH